MIRRRMSWLSWALLAAPLLALLVLATRPATPQVQSESQPQPQPEPTCASLVITGHPSYPPVAWAAQGEIVGAAPDLVTGIAAKLGVKDVVAKDFGSWAAAQAAARSGEADVIFGIYKNDERETYLDYVEPPFMLDPVAIVVRKGARFKFTGWDDLKGRVGVTNAGESFGNAFDSFMASELTVKRAEGVDQAFVALLAHQADYLIIGLYPGKNVARRLNIADQIEVLPKELLSSPMYVAFSKRSKCDASMQVGFSAYIKVVLESGTMRQLLDDAEKSLGK